MKKILVSRVRQAGQGMSEYIIIVALVAVAGIAIFGYFGDVLGNQTAAMAKEMAGKSGKDQVTAAGTSSDSAATQASQKDNLSNYAGQNKDAK